MIRPLLNTLCLTGLVVTLSGCESLSTSKPRPTPAPVITPTANNELDGYIDMLAVLSGNDRARQSEVFFDVERAFTQAPTTLNQVRLALALALPGHPAADAVRAKKLLEQALASPERLSGTEKALCEVMLGVTDQWLKVQTENRRLVATVDDKSRSQSNADRRFQTQAEEILRLRKALDTAQQKLDAIKDLEKSISERSASPTGTRDSSNRDNPSQTQTTPAGR